MATCVPFQSQLSSIMEVLVKAAVAEISKLVDDKCAFLHLEISRKQSENEMLKRKLVMMENKTALLQRGFGNYMDRGTDLGNNCAHPTGNMKFPEIEAVTGSFTIKEESPDEALWLSDSTGSTGPTVQYANAPNTRENVSEATRPKTSDFSGSFNSGQHVTDINGLQFTVKTEKEENQLGFGQDGCQHGKQTSVASDFSLDERENHLWSPIIEGEDIDDGFPDFSCVVEEYSSTFPEHSEANMLANSGKPSNVQQPSSQRLCNGIYSGDYQKEAPQHSGFQPRPNEQEKPNEQIYQQRNISNVQPDAEPERDVSGDRSVLTHSHSSFPQSGFFTANKQLPSVPRGYTCSVCGKSFGWLHQFKLHQQSHKRKRAFWCSVCGKSFQCSSHLSIHHRTHTGEKPYGCGQCGKRFTQQSSLRVHQRTHSGERPYSCSHCGKTFILMHHLKRHRIIHTYS